MSGSRRPVVKQGGQLVRLEERVTAIEIQNAERFATIVSELKHLRDGISALLNDREEHDSRHKDAELQLATLTGRVSVVEESYKNFHKKLWGLAVAIIGSIGTGVIAVWNAFKP